MLPLTREENWLAKIAGDPDADEAMKPRTRKEYFLNEIAENGGGGGGGQGGVLVVGTSYDEETNIVTLDKTWQEINDAAWSVTIQEWGDESHTKEWMFITNTAYITEYNIYTVTIGGMGDFFTSNPNGYPTNEEPVIPDPDEPDDPLD